MPMDAQTLARTTPRLEKLLTPARLAHSLGVMQTMGELAPIYGLDPEQAALAGLLHDAAKDLPPDQQAYWVQAGAVEIRYPCDRDYLHYLHGPVGACLVQAEFGVSDPLVLEAIATHTYAGAGPYYDSPLAWCVRFSDILEPNRRWTNVPQIRDGLQPFRRLVFAGQLDAAAQMQTGWIRDWFTETGRPVHPNLHHWFGVLSERVRSGNTGYNGSNP